MKAANEAFGFCIAALQMNQPQPSHALTGLRFLCGTDVPKDEKQAIESFRQAAQEEDPLGFFMLGTCWGEGIGTWKNPAAAFTNYERARSEFLPEAIFNCGVCKLTGEGTSRNPSAAVEDFREASRLGVHQAGFNLAVCYEFGIGVEKNEKEAQALYEELRVIQPEAGRRVHRHLLRSSCLKLLIALALILLPGIPFIRHVRGEITVDPLPCFFILVVAGTMLLVENLMMLWLNRGSIRAEWASRRLKPEECFLPTLKFPVSADFFAPLGPKPKPLTIGQYQGGAYVSQELLLQSIPEEDFGLEFMNSGVTDDVLKVLARNERLKAIYINACPKVTVEGLRQFVECPNLKTLAFSGGADLRGKSRHTSQVTDEWLELAAQMPQLEELAILGCANVTDAGVEKLQALTQLKRLRFYACPRVTDAALSRLVSAMPRLKELEIGTPSSQGGFLKAVAKLVQLQSLTLVGLKRIRREFERELAALPMLEILHLYFCRKISGRQSRRLNKALPRCMFWETFKTHFDFWCTFWTVVLFFALSISFVCLTRF